jgi:prevent-host-death family protein
MVARTVTLSEAKARLSELLDAVEQGETVVVVRRGRRIAIISRCPSLEGQPTPLSERLSRLQARWAEDLAAIRASDAAFDPSPAGLKRLAREGLR